MICDKEEIHHNNKDFIIFDPSCGLKIIQSLPFTNTAIYTLMACRLLDLWDSTLPGIIPFPKQE